MRIGTTAKVTFGILGIVVAGFIGFQMATRRSVTVVKETQVEGSARQITAPRFVKRASETITKTPKEEAPEIEVPKAEEVPVPEEVPTAQSSDDEIREFLAWLSSLDAVTSAEKTETDSSDEEENEADYDREISLIDSVIWEKWKKGYETYDVERYMSAIWEDDFFYTSDMGTSDDPSDDVIFRGGQQERESAARIFNKFTKNIELNLSPRSDIEFLSDSIAMVEYDYELKLSRTPTPESKLEMFYAPGYMTIILERRKNSEGIDEWRILEWYDHARK